MIETIKETKADRQKDIIFIPQPLSELSIVIADGMLVYYT